MADRHILPPISSIIRPGPCPAQAPPSSCVSVYGTSACGKLCRPSCRLAQTALPSTLPPLLHLLTDSDRKYRNYQFFTSTSWPGGVYASPSLAGSRPGALLAGAWAALLSMGEEGYLESCKSIVGAARRIEAGIREKFSANDELQVLGEPKVTVVAFKSDTLDVLQVGDKMSEKGWHRELRGGTTVNDDDRQSKFNLPSLDCQLTCCPAWLPFTDPPLFFLPLPPQQ